MSSPLRLFFRFILNIVLIWFLATYLDEYLAVSGGITAFIVIGALITLMNLIVRPILGLLTFPLKLFATILAIIIVNGGFLWITYQIVKLMEPQIGMQILGGIGGWIVLSLVLGVANWVMKEILHKR
jgi:putative membrane protein